MEEDKRIQAAAALVAIIGLVFCVVEYARRPAAPNKSFGPGWSSRVSPFGSAPSAEPPAAAVAATPELAPPERMMTNAVTRRFSNPTSAASSGDLAGAESPSAPADASYAPARSPRLFGGGDIDIPGGGRAPTAGGGSAQPSAGGGRAAAPERSGSSSGVARGPGPGPGQRGGSRGGSGAGPSAASGGGPSPGAAGQTAAAGAGSFESGARSNLATGGAARTGGAMPSGGGGSNDMSALSGSVPPSAGGGGGDGGGGGSGGGAGGGAGGMGGKLPDGLKPKDAAGKSGPEGAGPGGSPAAAAGSAASGRSINSEVPAEERLPTSMVGAPAVDAGTPSGKKFSLKPGGPAVIETNIHLTKKNVSIVGFTAKMAIDDDGDGGGGSGDSTYQKETSLRYPDKSSLNPRVVPFVVIPLDFPIAHPNVKLGDYSSVTYGGKTLYAIVGDMGPKGVLGEGSTALAKGMGINSNPVSGGLDTASVRYLILPGSGAKFPIPRKSSEVQERGRLAFEAAGAEMK